MFMKYERFIGSISNLAFFSRAGRGNNRKTFSIPAHMSSMQERGHTNPRTWYCLHKALCKRIYSEWIGTARPIFLHCLWIHSIPQYPRIRDSRRVRVPRRRKVGDSWITLLLRTVLNASRLPSSTLSRSISQNGRLSCTA